MTTTAPATSFGVEIIASTPLVLLARALVAEGFVVATACVAYAIAAQVLHAAPRLIRLTGTLVAGLWLATLGFHGLTLLEAFRVLPAAVALLLLALGTWALERRTGRAGRAWSRDCRFLSRLSTRWRRSRWRGPSVLIAIALIPVVLRPLVVPVLSWDGLTYHGLRAALPVQTGAAPPLMAPGQWAYAGPIWAGHEALQAWAMLPFHGDLLAPFAEAVQFAGLGLALFVLAREARVREPLGSLAAVVILSTPTCRLLVGSGYVEVGAMLALTAALGLLAAGLRLRSAGLLLFGAAALGVAGGMKISLPPVVAPLGLLFLLGAWRLRSGAARRLGVALTGVAVAGACVAPWMLRGLTIWGAPFSPLSLEVAGLTLGIAPPEMVEYSRRPELPSHGMVDEWAALARTFIGGTGRNETLDPASAALLLLGAIGAVRALRRRPFVGAAALSVCGAAVLAYLNPDFATVRHLWNTASARFLLPALVALGPLAGVGITAAAGPGRILALGMASVAIVRLLVSHTVGVTWVSVSAMLVAAAGLVLMGSVLWRLPRWSRGPGVRLRGGRRIVAALLIALGLVGLDALRDRTREPALAREFQIHDFKRHWVPAVPLVDDPTRRHRIAVTSGPAKNLDNWSVLPFLGRKLQNEVVYVPPTADGHVPSFGSAAVNERFARTVDARAWIERLDRTGVTHVLTFAPRSIEQDLMEARPGRFRKLAGGVDWGLFEIARRDLKRPHRSEDGGIEYPRTGDDR